MRFTCLGILRSFMRYMCLTRCARFRRCEHFTCLPLFCIGAFYKLPRFMHYVHFTHCVRFKHRTPLAVFLAWDLNVRGPQCLFFGQNLNVQDLNVFFGWDLNVWDLNVQDLNVRDLKVLAPL